MTDSEIVMKVKVEI